jgi:hypothetical protein
MNDLRLAIRSLGRSPGFVLIAIITLGLGIGANTSAFSLFNEERIHLRSVEYGLLTVEVHELLEGEGSH